MNGVRIHFGTETKRTSAREGSRTGAFACEQCDWPVLCACQRNALSDSGRSRDGVPTKIGPFLTTGLFSLPGKLRAGMDLVLPASKPQEDQSLGEFFRRRVGGEVVENLIEPLLSGIYAGDIDRLSLMSTFPQFYQTEQKYRSLIIGMKNRAAPRAPESLQTKRKASSRR